jgi:polyhydroxyalkanoate synthesis regulator phasin
MYSILYHHGFGTDVFNVQTEQDARIYICELINEWIGDLFDAEAELQISKLIAEKQWDAARSLYEEKSNESFEILCKQMIVVDDALVVNCAKNYIQKLEKELKEIENEEF